MIVRKLRRENLPIRTAIWTALGDVMALIDSAPRPDNVFRKPDTEQLLEWLGGP
jgi:hypothetical protein